ncbi:hairy-related 13 isoform X2 [Gadus macrocephalus]|uniref:hairy-related 13 isoform X2 n=1 Tax=Gadus macrocephalus TaxID=80720 RepID=UPI0028CBBE10|nr:hairy-related 13 isoform X2 [Gadus macrocephalus]
MAPSARPSVNELDTEEEEEDYYGIQRGDRKTRKPLVEKKRRARINESLQELRNLLADADSKMENAEVLEMTVKKVEDILQNRTQETDTLNREASERFAAGYIQCMHEVHMFVSNCPGIDATVAAELLNHLLECMPLNEDHFTDVLMDLITDTTTTTTTNTTATTTGGGHNGSTWQNAGDALCASLASPGGRSISSMALSPAPSSASSEDLCSDLCSDLDDTDSEHNQSSEGQGLDTREATSTPTGMPPTVLYSQSMWRPW